MVICELPRPARVTPRALPVTRRDRLRASGLPRSSAEKRAALSTDAKQAFARVTHMPEARFHDACDALLPIRQLKPPVGALVGDHADGASRRDATVRRDKSISRSRRARRSAAHVPGRPGGAIRATRLSRPVLDRDRDDPRVLSL